MKNKKILLIIGIAIIVILITTLCYGYYKKATKVVQNPIVTMQIEGFGEIKLELYPDIAPDTVANFITLANRGFYDGLTFHRILKDFMTQGGDANGDGTGSPKLVDLKDEASENPYSITGEFALNGYENNTLRHEKGVISMARSDYSSLGLYEEGYNSAGSQFFIVTKDTSSLNGQYAAFGRIIEGWDVLDAVASVEVTAEDEDSEVSTPINKPVITSIKVDTFGVDYGLPTTLEPFDYQAWLMQQYGIDSNYFE